MPDPLRWIDPSGAGRLLVVGGASLDVLHVRGARVPSIGGAGLYTALAAARAGVDVTMLAPRPDPMPEELRVADGRIRWVGPVVPPEQLPRFEIAYDDAGEVSLFEEFLGAEPDLRPSLLDGIGPLPRVAYCVPFLDAGLQHAFVRALLERGCVVAANTYGLAARTDPDTVRATAGLVHAFFCNRSEAAALFGDPLASPPSAGALRFVTLGAEGALVQQGDHTEHVRAAPVTVLDPTGAGDTFCGTVLGALAGGAHPVVAARRGSAAAGHEVTGVGPARLLEDDPAPAPAARVVVDDDRVDAMARLVAGLDEVQPFGFVADVLPPVGDPVALDWFTAATLQQFGFWSDDGVRYAAPVIAPLDGVRRKGSDHLWALYDRWRREDPAGLGPAGQAAVDAAGFARRFTDDDGATMPELAMRHACTAAYGRSMTALGWTPALLVDAANGTARPADALVRLLDHVGGYREDPYRKKSALLAAIARQRPEGWLRAADGDDVPAIVDYHVQRTCLRTGLVRVLDDGLRASLTARRIVGADDEDAVRRACFDAVTDLAARSGRSMGAVDWFLFQMRSRCPETSDPVCAACPADPACSHRTELFQPVFRTSAY